MLQEALDAAAAGKSYQHVNVVKLFAVELAYIDERPYIKIGQLPREIVPAIPDLIEAFGTLGHELTLPICWSSPIPLRHIED